MAQAHMIAGATSWTVYNYYFEPLPEATLPETLGLMMICTFAALLPDIDHPTSTLGRKIYPISKAISMVFGYRGFTHSLLALIGMIYLLVAIAPAQEYGLIIAVMSVGYLSHLVGDVITPAGLPLLYPIKYRFKAPFTIKTGGTGELIVVTLYALFALALYTKWPQALLKIMTKWLA